MNLTKNDARNFTLNKFRPSPLEDDVDIALNFTPVVIVPFQVLNIKPKE